MNVPTKLVRCFVRVSLNRKSLKRLELNFDDIGVNFAFNILWELSKFPSLSELKYLRYLNIKLYEYNRKIIRSFFLSFVLSKSIESFTLEPMTFKWIQSSFQELDHKEPKL